MPTERLTPDAREAVRAYIRRYFAVSALLATIAGGVLVFALNHIVLRNAQLEANAALSEQLHMAEREILLADNEAKDAQKRLKELAEEVHQQRTEQTTAHTRLTERLREAEEKYINAAAAAELARLNLTALADDVEEQREEHMDLYDSLALRVDAAEKDYQDFADASADAKKQLDELITVVKTKFDEIEALKSSLQSAQDLADAMRKADTFVSTVSRDIVSNPKFLNAITDKVYEPNIYLLKPAPCGKEHKVPVPIDETETDDWLVFGINPSITSMTESPAKSGDNAVFSFSTSIRPSIASDSWIVDYSAIINYASTSHKRLKISPCPSHIPPLQLVAIRAYNGLQELDRVEF